MNAIEESLKRLERGVLSAVKETMQRYPQELSIYVREYLIDPNKKDGLAKRGKYLNTFANLSKKKSKKNKTAGDLYYTVPNKTKKLRTLYGNIQRAVTPKGKGNISEVELVGGKIVARYGIDGDTTVTAGSKTTTLTYAVEWDKGERPTDRPFTTPGFKKFMSDAQGYKALMAELETAIVELANG